MAGPTPSQTVGPFFGFALPFPGDADAVQASAPGSIRLEGRVLDGEGEPVSDALLELWEGDQLARCRTDPEGHFHFNAARPDSGWFELFVFARGLLRHLWTRVYLPDAVLEDDPVLALAPADRRKTLIASRDGAVLHHDIHLQGDGETVFLELP